MRDPVFDVNSKTDSAAWADRMGVRRPAVHARVPRAQDLPWAELPERFVVKPVHGAASRGVHLLERRGAALVDVRDGASLTEDAVVERLSGLAADGLVSAETLVEELVLDPLFPGAAPADWKFTTFFGDVGLIEGKVGTSGGPRWRAFDDAWRPVGPGYAFNRSWDESIRPPLHADDLLTLARRISAAVPRPFVRVDLYDSLEGPVFGEITPEPGGPGAYRPDLDRRLGEAWEAAEGRLLARAARAGWLDPADHPLPGSAVEPDGRGPTTGGERVRRPAD
ncbi:ATP-grasp fold amidoligase family protein [Pseudokineococcus sp. 5B2Z-1]|uniref:ATP-grasp fold amidoligase family protein n=1 Tax=Pseudokineococcus sp. 5B2Z-1 TaxID=3132744 RepID=UPI00309CCA9A